MTLREQYALVLWLEEPRSADVVLKTSVVPDSAHLFIMPGQERKVMWGNTAYPARIVQTGTKTNLNKIKVSRDGEVLVEAGPDTLAVTTRKKALAVLESRAAKRRGDALDALDTEVLVAAAAPERLPSFQLPPNVLAELKERVKELDSMKPHHGDLAWQELPPGGIWIMKVELHFILRRHRRHPSKMYRALMTAFMTEELLCEGGFTMTEKPNKTVAIPPNMLKAALAYTSQNARSEDGKSDFNFSRSTTNFLEQMRRKGAKSDRGSNGDNASVS